MYIILNNSEPQCRWMSAVPFAEVYKIQNAPGYYEGASPDTGGQSSFNGSVVPNGDGNYMKKKWWTFRFERLMPKLEFGELVLFQGFLLWCTYFGVFKVAQITTGLEHLPPSAHLSPPGRIRGKFQRLDKPRMAPHGTSRGAQSFRPPKEAPLEENHDSSRCDPSLKTPYTLMKSRFDSSCLWTPGNTVLGPVSPFWSLFHLLWKMKMKHAFLIFLYIYIYISQFLTWLSGTKGQRTLDLERRGLRTSKTSLEGATLLGLLIENLSNGLMV